MASAVPWLVDVLPLCLHVVFHLYVSLGPNVPFLQAQNPYYIRAHLNDIILTCLKKPYFQRRSHL